MKMKNMAMAMKIHDNMAMNNESQYENSEK
jgi:hypothetical protein